CELKADKKEYAFKVDDDENDHQLSLKTVSLGGFEITPPVTLRLKAGSGPVYVSGQHLIALEEGLESSDEEEEEEEDDNAGIPQAAKPKSAQKSNHNGKLSEPSTPAKPAKTPEQKGKQEAKQSPKTPKTPFTPEEIKAKMQGTLDKGGALPKIEPKFTNYVKNCFRMDDQKMRMHWSVILAKNV
ncbi:hypothetical protein AB205_0114890, partial [Aquarana catesbeiana]